MSRLQSTAIIRDRGQLTIPEKIRDLLKWPVSNSVVTLDASSENELVIKPFTNKKQVDWASIWQNIKLSRTFEGERGDLSTYIIADRESH